eukprot:6263246-Ditylum_brightwellii.AAC.1
MMKRKRGSSCVCRKNRDEGMNRSSNRGRKRNRGGMKRSRDEQRKYEEDQKRYEEAQILRYEEEEQR